MDAGRRRLLGAWAATVTGIAPPFALPQHMLQDRHARPDPATATGTGSTHERFMRLAVEQARRNPEWPFGAVIVDSRPGAALGEGGNAGAAGPGLPGEAVARK